MLKEMDNAMSSQSSIHIEIPVPLAATEQIFLRLAVETAVKKFREMQLERVHSTEEPSFSATVDRSINNTAIHNMPEFLKRLEAVS
jgi:hypothetical protein